VSERQLALNSLANAVILLSDVMTKPTPNGKRIICAMVENDLDDLELKALNILLESQGSEILNLGAGSSTDSVAHLVQIKQPHFVFLLASAPHHEDNFVVEHQKICDVLRTYGGKLIIGGPGYTPELMSGKLDGLFDMYCASFKEFAAVLNEKYELKKKEKE
jgi:methanogenic corrinoid protein MtbC1